MNFTVFQKNKMKRIERNKWNILVFEFVQKALKERKDVRSGTGIYVDTPMSMSTSCLAVGDFGRKIKMHSSGSCPKMDTIAIKNYLSCLACIETDIH